MLTYEIAAMLCIATFALGMGMGVFAVDMMRHTQSLPMHEPIEHDPLPWCDHCDAYVGVAADCYFKGCPRRAPADEHVRDFVRRYALRG